MIVLNKESDEVVINFRDLLVGEQTEEETTTFFKAAIFEDEESKAEKYLKKLSNDDFYYVINAWDIGRDIMNSSYAFGERLEFYEDEKDLFVKNLKEVKREFDDRSQAEDYFLEKKESLVKKQLDSYIYRFDFSRFLDEI